MNRNDQLRTTHNERICPDCEGAGEITVNTSNPHGYGPDPQQDRDVHCSSCGGIGWLRTVPADPMTSLAALRRAYRHLPTVYGLGYGALRQRIVSPVCLPGSVWTGRRL